MLLKNIDWIDFTLASLVIPSGLVLDETLESDDVLVDGLSEISFELDKLWLICRGPSPTSSLLTRLPEGDIGDLFLRKSLNVPEWPLSSPSDSSWLCLFPILFQETMTGSLSMGAY